MEVSLYLGVDLCDEGFAERGQKRQFLPGGDSASKNQIRIRECALALLIFVGRLIVRELRVILRQISSLYPSPSLSFYRSSSFILISTQKMKSHRCLHTVKISTVPSWGSILRYVV
jgi:hypothetical protein